MSKCFTAVSKDIVWKILTKVQLKIFVKQMNLTSFWRVSAGKIKNLFAYFKSTKLDHVDLKIHCSNSIIFIISVVYCYAQCLIEVKDTSEVLVYPFKKNTLLSLSVASTWKVLLDLDVKASVSAVTVFACSSGSGYAQFTLSGCISETPLSIANTDQPLHYDHCVPHIGLCLKLTVMIEFT